VRFSQPLPSGNYSIGLTPNTSKQSLFVLGYTSKTASGFNVLLKLRDQSVGQGVQVSGDWLAVPFSVTSHFYLNTLMSC